MRVKFLIDAFDSVAGPETATMGFGKVERGEALGEVMLHPCSQFWGSLLVVGDSFLKPRLRAGEVRAMEDGAYIGGDYAAKFKPGNVGPGVLLEMELTPLPRNGGKDRTACGGTDRTACGSQSGVSVADDEL